MNLKFSLVAAVIGAALAGGDAASATTIEASCEPVEEKFNAQGKDQSKSNEFSLTGVVSADSHFCAAKDDVIGSVGPLKGQEKQDIPSLLGGGVSIFGATDWIKADDTDGGEAPGDGALTFGTLGPTIGGKSGDWSIEGDLQGLSVMMVLKAANFWGAFLLDALSGTWSSSDHELSHATLWYSGTPNVPPGRSVQDPPSIPLPAGAFLILSAAAVAAATQRGLRSR